MRTRRGVSVLLIVCVLAFIIGLVALAVHNLQRGSSRSLFNVQEHRELVNLGHSAISEALFSVEVKLEQGASEWVDWCTSLLVNVKPRQQAASTTEEFVTQLTGENGNLTYKLSKVELQRVQGAPLAAGMSARLGVIDFVVTVEANRATPAHHVTLKMTRRHAFWFSDGATPFTDGGRHIEILPTPVATILEHQ